MFSKGVLGNSFAVSFVLPLSLGAFKNVFSPAGKEPVGRDKWDYDVSLLKPHVTTFIGSQCKFALMMNETQTGV